MAANHSAAASAAASTSGEGGGGSGSSIVVARYAYKAVDDSELTVKKSERLLLLDDSQHWWRVQNASGQEGYVPSNYMKRGRQGLFSSLKSSLSKKKKKRGGGGGEDAGGSRERSQSTTGGANDKLPMSPPEAPLPPLSNPHAAAAAAAATVAAAAAHPAAPTPRIAVARYAYAATQEDELTLAKGDKVAVLEESSDGWWRGRRLSGGRAGSGWFPSNYVAVDIDGAGGSIGNGGDDDEDDVQEDSDAAVADSAAAAAAGKSPPTQQAVLFRVLALYRFTASHSEEMDFAENETLSVLATPADDPEWWLARSASGRQGLVPRNYVRPLPPDGASSSSGGGSDSNPRLAFVSGDSHPGLADRPFYWGCIGRSEADRMLMQMASPGEFIVRAGESNPEDLTLTMRAKAKNRNFKIRQVEEPNGLRYNIGQKYFTNLEDLIRHYQEHPIYRSDEERCYLVAPFQHPSVAGTKL